MTEKPELTIDSGTERMLARRIRALLHDPRIGPEDPLLLSLEAQHQTVKDKLNEL